MARTRKKSLGGNFNEAGAKSAGKRMNMRGMRFCITDFNEAGAKSAGKQGLRSVLGEPREDFNEAGAKSAGKLARTQFASRATGLLQ